MRKNFCCFPSKVNAVVVGNMLRAIDNFNARKINLKSNFI